jgi:phage terminase small subunit
MPTKPREPVPEPPADLSEKAAEAWRSFAAQHRGGATPADLVALRQLVDVHMRLDAVREQLDADGVMVAGSQGQQRAHPLIGVERDLRSEADRRMLAWRRACGETVW